jgi:hypothetical protein
MATLFDEQDVKKYILHCPDENINYPSPDTMYRPDGSSKYAYVTLVMIGDKYISAAIVLAYSLIKSGSKADRVVLVTRDVSEGGRQILALYFNKIVVVDYVKTFNWRGKHQLKDYLNKVFTKFHLFNLTQYEKVVLIDADAMIMKYPDHLFTLNAPAGCYIEDKNLLISYDEAGNYILPEGNTFKWYQEYCNCCGHGKNIPKNITDGVIENKNNSGIGGGLMVLAPKLGEFDRIIRDISHGSARQLFEQLLERIKSPHELSRQNFNNQWLVNKFFVWPEQQYLTYRYSGQWTGINPRFFGLQGYPHYKMLFGLQFGGDKPFITDSKFDIEIRKKYPDFIFWHQYYYEIIQQYPNLIYSNPLKEANQMNKYFINNYGSRLSGNSDLIKNIYKLYNVPEYKINKHDLMFYPVNTHDFNAEPINSFNNISDWKIPIKILANYYGQNSYFNRLYNKIEKIDNIDQITDQYDLSSVINNYNKGREKLRGMIMWGEKTDKIDDFIKTHGGVIFYKHDLILSKNGVENMLFNLYYNIPLDSRLQYINSILNIYPPLNLINNNVQLILIDKLKDFYFGFGTPYKEKMRKIYKNLGFVELADTKYQTQELINNLIHPTTRKYVLESNNINNININNIQQQWGQVEYLRRWCNNRLNNNIKYIENSLILDHESVWMPYGIINGLKTNITVLEEGWLKQKKIYESIANFIKYKLVGSEEWFKTYYKEQNRINKKMGTSIKDLIQDPHNFMYFMGFHMVVPEMEISRKLSRMTTTDYGDLIMLTLYHRDIIGDNLKLDKYNKLMINVPSYHQMFRQSNEWDNLTWKQICDRYQNEEIKNMSLQIITLIKPSVTIIESSDSSDNEEMTLESD